MAVSRTHASLGAPPLIDHIQLPLRPWVGEFLARAPENAGKGRGQVYSLDGTEPHRSCQEVEVAKRLRIVRENAWWITDWPQLPRTPWTPWALRPDRLPDWVRELDDKIRKVIRSRKGGMPDVVAWNDRDGLASMILVECKGPNEPFREAQQDWVSAACCLGLNASQFAVALRPGTAPTARRASPPAARQPRAGSLGRTLAASSGTSPAAKVAGNLGGAALRRVVEANTHRKPDGLKRIEAGVYDLPHGGRTYRITQTGPFAWETTLDGKRVGEVQPNRREAYLMVRSISGSCH